MHVFTQELIHTYSNIHPHWEHKNEATIAKDNAKCCRMDHKPGLLVCMLITLCGMALYLMMM